MEELIGKKVSYEGLEGEIKDYFVDTQDGNISVLLRISFNDNEKNDKALNSLYKEEVKLCKKLKISVSSYEEFVETIIVNSYNDGISISEVYLYEHD